MSPPVLLPARFVVLRAERMLLAPAHCLDAIAGNSQRNEILLRRIRAPLPQSEVVLFRAALVAVPLERYADLRIGTQELRILLQRRSGITANLRLVVIEVRVLDVLIEQVAHAWRRLRFRRRSRGYRDLHVCRRRAAWACRRNRVRCSLRRTHVR